MPDSRLTRLLSNLSSYTPSDKTDEGAVGLLDRPGFGTDATRTRDPRPKIAAPGVMRATPDQPTKYGERYSQEYKDKPTTGLEAALRAANEGTGLSGLTERASSALRSVVKGTDYKAELEQNLRRDAAAQQEHPIASFAGNLVGNAALFAAGTRTVGKALDGLGMGKSAVGRTLFPEEGASLGRKITANYLGGGVGPALDVKAALQTDGDVGDKAEALAKNVALSAGMAGVFEGGLHGLKGKVSEAPKLNEMSPTDLAAAVQEFNARPMEASLGQTALATAGHGAVPIMGGISGGIGGGAYGATQGDTPGERIKNALLYGAMGAAAGAGLGKLGGESKQAELDLPNSSELGAVGGRGKKKVASAEVPAPSDPAAPVVPEAPVVPPTPDAVVTPGATPLGPANPQVREFVGPAREVTSTGKENPALRTFAQDPTGEAMLSGEVSRIIEQGGEKLREPVTWEQTMQHAQAIGIDVTKVRPDDVRRMSGAEMLAIRNVVTTNIDNMAAAVKRLADPLLPQSERTVIAGQLAGLDHQNDQLLQRFIKSRSAAGRDLQSLRILANRVDDPFFWMMKAKNILGDRWAKEGDAITAKINAFVGEKNTNGLVDLLMRQRKSTFGEKTQTFWKANLLTNPLTHIVNVSSNLTVASMEAAKNAPAAVADKLMSLAMRGNTAGRRTVAAPSFQELGQSLKGARDGVAEGLRILKGQGENAALEKYDIGRRTNYDNVILDTYVNTVFNLLSAEDKVSRGAAYQASLANQARALAASERLKGPAFAERVKVALATPDDHMVLRAISDAEEAVFQDKTFLGNALGGLSKSSHLMGYVLPFTKTPGAVATRTLEYSPFGAIAGTGKVVNVIQKALRGKDVSAEAQRSAARLFGRGMVGTSAVAAGYLAAASGILTGQTDKKDKVTQQTNQMLGVPDASLKVGDTFLDVSRLQPLGTMLVLGANLYKLAQGTERKDPLALAGTGAASIVRSLADQPFLTGIKAVTNAIDDPAGKPAASFADNILGGFVPMSAGLAAVARASDPRYRQPTDVSGFLQSRLPGLSKDQPGGLDQFGAPAQRESGFSGTANALFNPVKIVHDQRGADPVKAEMSRLGLTLGRRKSGQGATDADVADVVSREGPMLHRQMAAVISSPQYAKVPDWQKAYVLSQVMSSVRSSMGSSLPGKMSRVDRLKARFGVQ